LAIKLEAKLFEPPHDIPILETGQPPHQVLTIKG